MFELLKKYGTLICHGAHTLADLVEAEGPAIVTALHELGNHASVAGRVLAGAEEVLHVATEFAPMLAASAPAPTIAAAVAAVDAEVKAGAFSAVVRPAFVNPLRQG